MLHIKPIQQTDASPKIAGIYKDIEQTFGVDTVPIVFQYIANYEQYFFFLWERMKKNIQAESFQTSCHEINTFAAQVIDVLAPPSDTLQDFIQHISPLEKQQINETITLLKNTNTTLMLLLIDLRESLKSIFIGTQRLTQYASEMHWRHSMEIIQKEKTGSNFQTKEMTEATNMLAPLFGTNNIIVSHYPDFFAHIASEMEKMKNTEAYLKSRVTLEHLALQSITEFTQPLGISYQEFLKLTQGKPYINELLFLLTDSFPSQFPHLVFTTAFMKFAILHS